MTDDALDALLDRLLSVTVCAATKAGVPNCEIACPDCYCSRWTLYEALAGDEGLRAALRTVVEAVEGLDAKAE